MESLLAGPGRCHTWGREHSEFTQRRVYFYFSCNVSNISAWFAWRVSGAIGWAAAVDIMLLLSCAVACQPLHQSPAAHAGCQAPLAGQPPWTSCCCFSQCRAPPSCTGCWAPLSPPSSGTTGEQQAAHHDGWTVHHPQQAVLACMSAVVTAWHMPSQLQAPQRPSGSGSGPVRCGHPTSASSAVLCLSATLRCKQSFAIRGSCCGSA